MKHITKISIVVLALMLVGAACAKKTTTSSMTGDQTSTGLNTTTNTEPSTNTAATTTTVHWMQTQDGWQADSTPPACPSPVVQTPVDLSAATSILYPGQTRGTYKPHGGFRFDGAKNNNQPITAAMDGEVVRGARYLISGETQYTFDVMSPCGVMYRLGHLLVLTPKFQAIADTFPPAQENDSRTTTVNPPVAVTAGETIATAIGVTKGGINVFVDFGVYDFKVKNTASQNAAYAAAHDVELAPHALCWFDYLTAADEATVRSLPAGDPTAGKTSDYCS